MDSSSCDSEKKVQHGPVLSAQDVDVAAQLAAGTDDVPLDQKVAYRLRYEQHKSVSHGLTLV